MRIDLGLEVSAQEFVRALTPIVAEIYDATPGTHAAQAAPDVANEAFNLACAFIDADGRATDAELAALLHAFAPLVDPAFARTTPAQARAAGLTTGKRSYLWEPPAMFEVLLGVDRRRGTSHSTTYYEHALAIGHMAASTDDLTTRSELLAIEDFRGMLLARIKATPNAPDPATTVEPAGATAAEGPGGAAADLPAARPLEELLAELDALVGLAEVKAEVKLVANLIQVQNLRRTRDLPVHETSRHLIFTGNPGTGKTTVARLLAEIYRTLGVVDRGQLVETDRAGLVAGYVGQTATRVTAAFDQADGGVLLIDEAYALVRGGEHDFGREAIDTIVKLVEDRRDRLVVIAAGYPDEMAGFVEANPGLRSRFPKTITFPDYSTDELVAIVASLGEEAHYRLDDEARERVRAWLDHVPRTKGFGNGRLARNLFEDAVARQATRIVSIAEPTDEQLVTLTAADIPDLPGSPDPTDPTTEVPAPEPPAAGASALPLDDPDPTA